MLLRLAPVQLGLFLLPVAAWDKDGHEAIGMVTMSALQNGPVHEVKRLMHGKDAVDVAGWAHKVNKKYPWTTDLHFQPQPSWTCAGADLSSCDGNRCLVKALRHFYGELVRKPSPADSIDWGKNLQLTDADRVKYLINLIGDLHQPLHFGFGANDCGRNITVQFRRTTSSLYDFWDSQITQIVMKESPGFWWGGWTHVQRTRTEYEKDLQAWEKEGVAMFNRWADENARSACEDVYRDPSSRGRNMTSEAANGPVQISERLFDHWKKEMLSKMLVAGARTAIVLNSILQQREAKTLDDGTAVKVEDEEEIPRAKLPTGGRRAEATHFHRSAWQGPSAFVLNAGIFFVVYVVFMLFMRRWQGLDVVIMADRAKHGGDTGKKV